jgi:tetratricopeptide (TPR) repeat protein
MKTLSKTVSAIIILFLVSGITYAQNPAKKSYKKEVEYDVQSELEKSKIESCKKGVEYGAQGEFEKARLEFVNVLELDPFYESAKSGLEIIKDVMEQKIEKETGIYLFKGVSNGIEGKYDDAINQFKKAIDINPEYAAAYNIRGIAYSMQGEYEKAISDFTKAVEIDTNYADAYTNRGLVFENRGEYNQAIMNYNQAIGIDSIQSFAYCNRGLIYSELGQYERAISDYTRAIEINPKFIQAYKNRAYIYHTYLEDDDKACADLKRACELGDCGRYNLVKEGGDCK